ncbi:hypothetical protein D6789_01490 [Candidatus Woesearchaeota archaeon]|nr:MAG: hypothetical protein D6789_01490 [Candidatus Woesearchaeota archaeon]
MRTIPLEKSPLLRYELDRRPLPLELRDTYAMADPQAVEQGLRPDEAGIDLAFVYESHHQ